jgi:hypothetical protein
VSPAHAASGFSGIGYRTDKVKVVKVSKKTGEPTPVPILSVSGAAGAKANSEQQDE